MDAVIHDFLNERPCIIESQLVEFLEVPAVEFNCEGNLDEMKFALGPNPNTGTFAIFNRGDETLLGTMQLFDGRGQLVHGDDLMIFPGLHREITLGDLPSDVYVLVMRAPDFQKAFKVAIVNN